MAEINTSDFLKLSKALKAAGRKELRKELNRGLKSAVKPLLPQAEAALAGALPSGVTSRGHVKQVVQVATGSNPGVRVAVRYGPRGGGGLGASNARRLNNQGALRHPLFGDRDRWFTTPVPGAKGWFDRTYQTSAPAIAPDVEAAIQRVIDRITQDAR